MTADHQYKLLYAVVVAGKSATFAENALRRFFRANSRGLLPYDYVAELVRAKALRTRLKRARTGSYGRLTLAFTAIAERRPDLMTAVPAELEQIHGIGPKTARFAIMWVRGTERFAALDTHVLKWLRFLGHDAPKATPAGEKYAALERIFLAEADRRGLLPRVLDGLVWDHCSSSEDWTNWPSYLQREPAPVPQEILDYWKAATTPANPAKTAAASI